MKPEPKPAVITGAKEGGVYFRRCLHCGKALSGTQPFCSGKCGEAHKGTVR